MPTQPLSLQDAIAAWLTTTQAGPSPAPAPEPTPDFRTSTTPADGLVDMTKPSQPKVDWRALALAAQGTTNARAEMQAMAAQAQMAQPTPWQNFGARMSGAMAGGVAGTQLGAMTGVPHLAILGGVGGTMVGAFAGDDFAQGREVAAGQRAARNPLESAAVGVGAAIPGGTLARGGMQAIPMALATGLPANAAGSLLVQAAEGNGLSATRTLDDAVLGTAMGVGAGAAIRGAQALPGAVRALAEMPAVQLVMADETGAVGPRIKGATAKNVESAYRMSSGAVKSDVRATMVELGIPTYDGLLAAARAGDERALAAMKLLRLDPNPPAPKTKAPTRVVTPAAQADLPLTPDVEPAPTAPSTYVEQRASGTRTVTVGRDAGAPPPPPPPPTPPVASAAAPEPPRGPRQPYAPEKPLDPTNLPDVIEPRRDLQPAQVAEDIERTARRNEAFLGMDPVTARTLAEQSATPEAQVQKRRIMPLSEIRAKGNAIEATIPPKGKALNAEQQSALQDHVRGVYDQVDSLNEQIGDLPSLEQGVLRGDPDAVAKVAALEQQLGVQGVKGIERARLELFDELAKWQLADEAVGSEWGRSGRARQMLASSRKLDDVEFLKKAYELGLPKPEALDALSQLRGNPDAQRQYLIDLYKPSGQEYWKAYLSFNMLSGVPTLAVNLESNALSYVRKEAARYQAMAMDKATAPKGTRVLMAPPAKLLSQSYADGMRHAYRAFMQAMRDGTTPLEVASVGSGGEVFKGSWLAKALETSGVDAELAKRLGKGGANAWKRMLLGTDAAFQMMAIYPEAYRRATAEAWNAGLRGQDLANGILERVRGLDLQNDTSAPIREYAKGVTFSNNLGDVAGPFQRFMNAIDHMTVKGADKAWAIRSGMTPDQFPSGSKYKAAQIPIGFMHVPFVRIAANLFKQAVQIAVTDGPVGAFNLGAKRGDRIDNLQRVAQASQAYALAGTLAALYQAGVVDFTTTAPESEFEKQQFYGPQGKRPWAIGVNGHYIPLASLGALGMALAPLGAYLKGVGTGDDATAAERLSAATAALAKVELDATFVRSAMTLFQGLTDERKQGKLMGNYVAQVTPASSGLRNVRDVVDPTLRDPKTFTDEVKAQLPGLSDSVAPRLDAWGQPIQRQPLMSRVTGATSRGEDYVGQELLALKESLPDLGRMDEGVYPADLKVSATSFEKTLEQMVNKGVTNAADGIKVRFTEQEQQQYMRLVGTATREALAAVIAPDNPEWTALTPQEKRALVKQLKDVGQEIGKELFIETWLGDDPR